MQVVYQDEIEEHTVNACGKTMVPCTLECGKIMRREELPSHYTRYCPFRKQRCQLCNDEMDYKTVYRHTTRLCPLRIVQCGRSCGASMKAVNKAIHELEICPLRPDVCRKCGLE